MYERVLATVDHSRSTIEHFRCMEPGKERVCVIIKYTRSLPHRRLLHLSPSCNADRLRLTLSLMLYPYTNYIQRTSNNLISPNLTSALRGQSSYGRRKRVLFRCWQDSRIDVVSSKLLSLTAMFTDDHYRGSTRYVSSHPSFIVQPLVVTLTEHSCLQKLRPGYEYDLRNRQSVE
jgi:hypothetical protein